MSRMPDSNGQRPRRQFDDEFKARAEGLKARVRKRARPEWR
jgi:hypothetical protein